MTAIMGLKEGNRIFIAADGRVSAENAALNCYGCEDDCKIKRVKGSPDCLIAFAGNANSAHFINDIDDLLDGKNDPSYNYIVRKTLPKIYSVLERKGVVTHEKNRCNIGCNLILATKTHLYTISQFGIVTEQTKVAFSGFGFLASYATYMVLKSKHLSPTELIRQCIQESIKRCDYVGYPIVIMENRKTAKTIIINEDK